MDKSESIKEIAKALFIFQKEVGCIKKNSVNPFFKSSYANLGDIQDAIEAPLEMAGLVYSQFPVGDNGLYTILIHTESGEFMGAESRMKPTKDDPQGQGSAQTYQRRYALCGVLGLKTEDDDGNHGSSKKTPQNASQPLTEASQSTTSEAFNRFNRG